MVVASAPGTGSRLKHLNEGPASPFVLECPWPLKAERKAAHTPSAEAFSRHGGPRASAQGRDEPQPLAPTALHPSMAHPENQLLGKLPSAERFRGKERGERLCEVHSLRDDDAFQDRRAAASSALSAPRARLPFEGEEFVSASSSTAWPGTHAELGHPCDSQTDKRPSPGGISEAL